MSAFASYKGSAAALRRLGRWSGALLLGILVSSDGAKAGEFGVPSILFCEEGGAFASEVVVVATGRQWSWEYAFPSANPALDVAPYASIALGGEAGLTPEVKTRLETLGYPPETFDLATAPPLVLLVGPTVTMQVTSADVIHAWSAPAFAVRTDGIPGRLNVAQFRIEQEGVYFGACDELCGRGHPQMLIAVIAVSPENFEAWRKCAAANGAEKCAPQRAGE